jgi:hypothetical protein
VVWLPGELGGRALGTDPAQETAGNCTRTRTILAVRMFCSSSLMPPDHFAFSATAGRSPGRRASRQILYGPAVRPHTLDTLANGRSIVVGLYEVQGYDPIQSRRYVDVTGRQREGAGLPHRLRLG